MKGFVQIGGGMEYRQVKKNIKKETPTKESKKGKFVSRSSIGDG